MNHSARAYERVQINLANGEACWVVVQGRISVRTDVRRQGDGAHIHWAMFGNLRRPIQLEWRVARKDRATGINGWGNVPNFFHEAQR